MPNDKTLPILLHKTCLGDIEPSCLGQWTGDQEPRSTVHGPYSTHLRPAFGVAWAKLAHDSSARVIGQRQGLLGPIHTVKPQAHGPGPPILGPRVTDHGPLVLVL